jgi:hypothetical protein
MMREPAWSDAIEPSVTEFNLMDVVPTEYPAVHDATFDGPPE